jgi:hypothetical protein
MSTHVSWGSIELLHNVIRTLNHLADPEYGGQPLPVVEYRGKIKLHGTNCAVQTTAAGIVCQSRNLILTPEADHKTFAKWAHGHASYWATLPVDLVVFGEWCGPGIEKGMAISAAPTKLFCVFGIQQASRDAGPAPLIYEPAEVAALLGTTPADIHVLPWEGEPITIDFTSRDALETAALALNDRVAEVEREDPWCKRVLGVSGLGEGLVFYPTPFDQTRMFKAKGDKHRTAGKKAVQVDASAAASVDDFVVQLVTEARLQQGLAAVGGYDAKQTGAFLAWVTADVKKESVAELEASKLTWAQVDKAVQAKARAWFRAGGLPTAKVGPEGAS